MLTVACVLKSGGIYDASWVGRLQAGVARHLASDHRFLCLSDVDVPCERIALEHGWPGWWSKLEAFKLSGPLLYFDLDTAIVGDLSDIAEQAYRPFVMLRDFYAENNLGSGVMAWGGAHVKTLFEAFAQDPVGLMKMQRARMGDQAFIEESIDGVARFQDLVGDQIASYKVHCRNGIPADARVICLHGRPKFEDMPATDPVRIAWEMAA